MKKILSAFVLIFMFLSLVSAWSVQITKLNDSPVQSDYAGGVSRITYQLNGINCINVSNVWFSSDNGSTLENKGCPGTEVTLTGLTDQESYNTWTIIVNSSSGEINNDSVTFWVDSIEPNVTLVNPALNMSYINSNTLNFIIFLLEANKLAYELPDKFLQLKIWNIISDASNEGDYDHRYRLSLDINNMSSLNHNLEEDERGEGNYTYRIYARDKYPNGTIIREIIFSGVIIRDTINPELIITSPNQGELYTYSINQITYNVSDSNIDYCQFSNLTELINLSCTGSYAIQSQEGQNNWSITSYDKAGNLNQSNVSFWVDSLWPRIQYTTGTSENNTAISQNSVFINVSVYEENFKNITYNLYNSTDLVNSTTYGSLISSINFSNLSEETYFYEVLVSDIVNHTNSTERRKIILDYTSPKIVYTLGTPENSTKSSFNSLFINVSIEEKNLANITYSLYNSTDLINSTVFSSYTNTINFTNLLEGIYLFNVTLVDLVSSINYTETREIQIDFNSPIIYDLSPGQNKAFNFGENITVEFKSNDSFSAINCSLILDLVEYSSLSNVTNNIIYNITLSNLSAGKHNYTINCTDSFNNTASSEPINLTVLANISFSDSTTNYTNLTQEEDISNVYGFFIENQYAKINFTQAIDFSSGIDFSNCINLSYNFVYINITCFSEFNKKAVITLYNLTWEDPRVLKNSALCTDCIELLYNSTNGTYVFSIIEPAEYNTEETPDSPTTPTSSSSSGSSSSCITEWTCTNWTNCIEGKQTRTCDKKVARCNTKTIKPEETKDCLIQNSVNIGNQNNNPSAEEIENKEEQEGFFAGITGAAIGALTTPLGVVLIFVVLIGGVYVAIILLEKKRTDLRIREQISRLK